MLMSDDPFPAQPALMSAIRARNLSRLYKGFADACRRDGYDREYVLAERDAQWWMQYALSLSQTPPGAIDKEG
jgi:hypothetical protein